jgi:hypothetical protein
MISSLSLPLWSIGLISQFHDHFTDSRTLSTGDELVARPLHKHRTTQTHTPNIHALCGIRTHDPGFWASEDNKCLTPPGYRDRRVGNYTQENVTLPREWISRQLVCKYRSSGRASYFSAGLKASVSSNGWFCYGIKFSEVLIKFTVITRAVITAGSQFLPVSVCISVFIYFKLATRVRSRVWSSGICGGQSGAGAGFLRVLRFPLPIFIPPSAPQSPSPIIWGWYNRPEVAAVQGTQSHPTSNKENTLHWVNWIQFNWCLYLYE